MSNLKIDQVKCVAKLAKLELKDDKINFWATQLSQILNFVEKIKNLKTEGLEPLVNLSGQQNVFREDKIEPSISQKEALKNSPSVYQGYFKVKAIFFDE